MKQKKVAKSIKVIVLKRQLAWQEFQEKEGRKFDIDLKKSPGQSWR